MRKEMNLVIVKMDTKLKGSNEAAHCVVHHGSRVCCEVLTTHLVGPDDRSCARGELHVVNCYIVSLGNTRLCSSDCGDTF